MMVVQDKITLDFAEFSLLNDRIVVVDYLNEEPMNVDRGIQLVESINKLTNDRPAAVIHNVGDKYIFTTDALRFMGSQLSTEQHHYLARAIVSNNSAARIASTNFLNLYKPLIPTRLFNNMDEALSWVEGVISSSK